MSARPTAMPLQVESAIAQQIKLHAQDFPELWSDQPATVDAGIKASHLDAPRPVIVVTVQSLSDLEYRTTDNVRTDATVEIFVAVDGCSDPWTALHELIADVRRAVMADQILAGEGNVLSTGWVRPEGVPEIKVDFDEGGNGTGVAMVRFIANYQWGIAAP